MGAPGERAAASSIVVILLAAALGGCGTLAAGLGGGPGDSLGLTAQAGTLAEPDRTAQAVAPTTPEVPPAVESGAGTPLVAARTGDPVATPAAPTPASQGEAAAWSAALAERADTGEPFTLGDDGGLPGVADGEAADGSDQGAQVARVREEGPEAADRAVEEYDPLEGFNEAMFAFNYRLDRYVIKPVAKAYDFLVPKDLQQMISNGFDNINVVPRVINSLLQGKWGGAGREVVRFLINSIAGIGGLWDIAKQEFNIPKSDEDFGQTLAVWGVGPGAYLVLPFLPPMTIRDGIGRAVDGAMDPLSYLLPFIWDRLGMKIGDTINERSLNLEFFEGVEETTVDLYTAVRNAYLQRRAQKIKE